MSRQHTTATALLAVVMVAAGMAVPAAAAPTVTANGGTVAPGDTVTISVDVSDGQTLEVSSIPGGWTVVDRTNDGAFGNSDPGSEGWVWSEDGSHSVTLTLRVPGDAADGQYALDTFVEKSDGTTATGSATVTVDGTAPTADAGSDTTVDEDTSVGFDAGGSSDNEGITSYQWAFGDGASGSGAQPSHTYSDPGEYTATVTVSDAAGNTATDTVTVTVEEAVDTTPPTADAGGNATAEAGSSVTFDASNSTDNVGVESYTWNFGDGSVAAGPAPSHTYDSPGNYTVTLTVTDAAGNAATDTVTVTVEEASSPAVPALPGQSNPAQDIDGDGKFEDVNGDGSADLFDALDYYNNGDSDLIQNNVSAFDFDGDGDAGDLFDALALWNEISG
ncbi:PKD domain-containing protein [Halapricum sp. CBA1109]|uniref:PKD domain-containing protein n=1 Tax=Halapricum sp. CBA1109 TaxID=2668068 RepID=UPI0012F902AF|nr:PKD domain-containing protein [Halapricum sp. CBA1109]MUV90971.1 PKD domain-containing protein [Halapricum sp. CBA1109]